MADELEVHKDTIIRLYVTEQKPLSEVMKIMNKDYNVEMKESRYKERLRKKWKIRKNIPHGQAKKIWRDVDKIYQSRCLEGKPTELYIGDNLRSVSSLRRNMSRYRPPPRFVARSPSLSPTTSTSAPQSFPNLRANWRVKTPPPSSLAIGILNSFSRYHSLHPRPSSYRLLGTVFGPLSRNVIKGLTPLLQGFLQSNTHQTLQYQGDQAKWTEDILRFILVKLANKQHTIKHSPGGSRKLSNDRIILEMVQVMVQRDPDWATEMLSLNDPDMAAVRETVFGAAIREREATLIRPLLAAGVCPNMMLRFSGRDKEFPQWFYVVSRPGPLHLLAWDDSENLAPALHFAALKGDRYLTEILIQSGADVNFPSDPQSAVGSYTMKYTPLSLAAANPDFGSALEMSKLLVSKKADINSCYQPSALIISILMENRELTAWLLDHGADLSKLYNECLSYATFVEYPGQPINRGLNIVETFEESGIIGGTSFMEYNTTALELIIITGDVSLFHIALEIQIYHQEAIGDDALTVACLAGHVTIVEKLIGLGANVNAESKFGLGPLTAASWDLSCRIPNICLAKISSVERQSNDPCTGVNVESLHIAAYFHNSALIEILLDKGADCNRLALWRVFDSPNDGEVPVDREEDQDEEWFEPYSALRLALDASLSEIDSNMSFRHQNVPLQLLEAGATLMGGELVQASRLGQSELMSQMLAKGSDVNEVWQGKTPLQAALAEGHLTAARLLIDKGAELKGGEFILAILGRQTEIVDKFISMGAMNDTMYETVWRWSRKCFEEKENCHGIRARVTVLWAAAETGNLDLACEYLLNGGLYDSNALLAAVAAVLGDATYINGNKIRRGRIWPKGHPTEKPAEDARILMDMVSLLVNWRLPGHLDAAEYEALCYAVKSNHKDLVELLLDSKFNPPGCSSFSHGFASSDHPLALAAASPTTSWILTRLLERGFRPTHEAWEHMFKFCQSPDFFNELELSSMPPCCRKELLFYAASAGHTGVLKQCLECPNTPVNFIRPYWGCKYTSLGRAAEGSHSECVRLLLAAGALADLPGQAPTALQHAARNGDVDMAERLIQNKADVDAPTSPLPYGVEARTALETAAEHGRIDMIRALFRNRVNVHGIKRVQMIRAVIYAEREGHHAVVSMLKELGGWTRADDGTMGILLSNPSIYLDIGSTSWDFAEEGDYGIFAVSPKVRDRLHIRVMADRVEMLKQRLRHARKSLLAVVAEQTEELNSNQGNQELEAININGRRRPALDSCSPINEPRPDNITASDVWKLFPDWSTSSLQEPSPTMDVATELGFSTNIAIPNAPNPRGFSPARLL